MNINTLPVIVTTIGIKTTIDLVSTSLSALKASASALISSKKPVKDISTYLAKSDLLFKFTVIKSFIDEIDCESKSIKYINPLQVRPKRPPWADSGLGAYLNNFCKVGGRLYTVE
jgi:hypothetical protein